MRSWLQLWRRQDGAAAVETALVLIVAFPFIIGMVEFANAYWNWNSLLLAVAEGGRYAMAHANSSTLAACTAPTPAPTITGCTSGGGNYASPNLPNCAAYETSQSLIGLQASSITITCSGSSPTTMTLVATYEFDFVASALLPYGPLTLTGRATVPLM
ncbi:MAG: TadE/TadG family type IV pilus assembly protein [Stellaceae bacterium]